MHEIVSHFHTISFHKLQIFQWHQTTQFFYIHQKDLLSCVGTLKSICQFYSLSQPKLRRDDEPKIKFEKKNSLWSLP